ncbi:ParB N-terminal domain-containing protein [Catenovulum maritimum]|uniref:ParB-like N-terminal domain-containing protein n=1 Tax=Catenovulum maritimum TaxID=1513271 RepID=A0A0J8H227_9ALTE|nr:ParB N-terminal domain-containing protein [Catenovulum maritimum]KMT67088.1 hypothetical protein XM47_00415 [Catenovulum maritimum]
MPKARAKRAGMFDPELLEDPSVTSFSIPSPTENNLTIELELTTIANSEILDSTSVFKGNERNQELLNQDTLSLLIDKIKDVGFQHTAALGRKVGDKVEVIFGSRRRLATHYAGVDYKIFVANEISDADALALTKSENSHETISLIEKGYNWSKYYYEDKLSFRDISEKILGGTVTHTTVGKAIRAAKIPKSIVLLYPSPNCIGGQTSSKILNLLSKLSDEVQSREDFLTNFIEAHQDLLESEKQAYKENASYTCTHLTNALLNYFENESDDIKLNNKEKWNDHCTVKYNFDGTLKQINFSKLSKAQSEFIKNTLSNL